MASIVAVKLGISSSAHKIGDSYALPFNDNVFLFIPYCEGEVITNWSEEQSHILGRKLASIHQLKLPNTNAKAFPEIYLPKFYLESYAELVKFCNQNKPDGVFFIHGIHYSGETMSQITCPKVGWLVDPVLNPERLQLFTSKMDWYFSYSQQIFYTVRQSRRYPSES